MGDKNSKKVCNHSLSMLRKVQGHHKHGKFIQSTVGASITNKRLKARSSRGGNMIRLLLVVGRAWTKRGFEVVVSFYHHVSHTTSCAQCTTIMKGPPFSLKKPRLARKAGPRLDLGIATSLALSEKVQKTQNMSPSSKEQDQQGSLLDVPSHILS